MIATLALCGLAVAGIALIPIGGLLVSVGMIFVALSCVGIIWRHWSDLRGFVGGWGWSKSATLPMLLVVLIVVSTFAALNKDALVAVVRNGANPTAPPILANPAAPAAPDTLAKSAQPRSPNAVTIRVPERAPKASRIVVTGFQFGQVTAPDSRADKFVNVTIENRGDLAGDNPIRSYQLLVTDAYLSNDDVNVTMAKLLKLAEGKPPHAITSQVDIGQQPFFTLNSALTADEWKDITIGKKRVYLMMLLTYTDRGLRSGEYWVSEYCASQSGGEAVFELCPVHNQVWLHK